MKNTKNTISCFAVSFKQGFISPNIPIATFYQGDKELNFIIDTGSENNVINQSALKEIKHTIINDGNTTHTLSGVGGTVEVSMCNIKFKCEEEEYNADFLVSDLDAPFKMIRQGHCIVLHGMLGSVFLRENNIILDFKNLAAYSRT